MLGPRLPPEERTEAREPEDERNEDDGTAPAEPALLDECEDGTGQPERGEHGACHVDPRAGPTMGCGGDARQQHQGDGDRQHVHREHVAPAENVDEKAAEERAEHESETCPRGPRTDGFRPGGARVGRCDHRERARHEQRCACALHGPRDDQDERCGRDGADDGCDPEDHEAGSQHADPAERVGDRPRDEDE